MILILKDADFSGNYLEQIPLDREISVLTKQVLKKYDSSKYSKAQIYALDDFLVDLQSKGIYDKFEFLYLPILATQESEMFIDLKGNTTCSSNTFKLVKFKGITKDFSKFQISEDERYINNLIRIQRNPEFEYNRTEGLHFAAYKNDDLPFVGGNGNYLLGEDSPYFGLTTDRCYFGALTVVINFTDTNIKDKAGLRLANLNREKCKASTMTAGTSFYLKGIKAESYDGKLKDSNDVDSVMLPKSGIGITPLANGANSVGFQNVTNNIALFSVGPCLTDEESIIYSTLAETFVNRFSLV